MSREAQLYWEALVEGRGNRVRFSLGDLLTAFATALPNRNSDVNTRHVLCRLLSELSAEGLLELPCPSSRRSFDYSERTALPKHVRRIVGISQQSVKTMPVWRPELGFGSDLGKFWFPDLLRIQEWFRSGGASKDFIAMRERSVEIFGDEKRLDALLGTQLFAPGRLTLELLRCYLPAVPVYLVRSKSASQTRPVLVLENHTTFDTFCRWNDKASYFSAIAFGSGTCFVAGCRSLTDQLSGGPDLLYFGDLDPKGLWIPARASQQSGLIVRPYESLYQYMIAKGMRTSLPRADPFRYDPSVLEWLPSPFREQAEGLFRSGIRLPQELISLCDLKDLRLGHDM